MQFNIRPLQAGDVAGLHAMRVMPNVYENLLAMPDESYERCAAFITGRLNSPTEHPLVAVTDSGEGGELVIGFINLSVSSRARTRHRGEIGMLVHAAYQSAGVGSALMKAVLDIADNWLMLERTELDAFCDNARAIHLYEKFGFVKEGLRRRAAVRNGEYVDEICMGRLRPGTE